jgi:hypothetical protein
MALEDPRSLLRPGREAEWEQINVGKRKLLAGSGRESLEARLRRGQRLSAQAARLRRAIVGH